MDKYIDPGRIDNLPEELQEKYREGQAARLEKEAEKLERGYQRKPHLRPNEA